MQIKTLQYIHQNHSTVINHQQKRQKYEVNKYMLTAYWKQSNCLESLRVTH